jgi:xyloglucan-specific exo-beta-1,4-glucanase
MEGDLWLAFSDRGLYHVANGGAKFVRVEAVNEARSLGFGKPADGKTIPTLYLAGKVENVAGLFRSTDMGATWGRINDEQHQFGVVHQLAGDPRIFGRVYLATSGRGIIYGSPGSSNEPVSLAR